MEAEFIKFPETKIQQLKDEVKREKTRRLDTEKQLSELKYRCQKNSEVIYSLEAVNKDALNMLTHNKNQIESDLNKVMALKKANYDLHIKMGCSSDKATYFMHMAAEEMDQIGEPVTNMIRKGYAENSLEGSSLRADKE